jgi:uncharacterized protein (DUF433 family)
MGSPRKPGYSVGPMLNTSPGPEPRLDRITFDPAVMGGRACIRGMRMTVALVANLAASGMRFDEIIAEYPDLETEDIRQALCYAARLAQVEVSTEDEFMVWLWRRAGTVDPALDLDP